MHNWHPKEIAEAKMALDTAVEALARAERKLQYSDRTDALELVQRVRAGIEELKDQLL